jgi:hypothetical protein
MDRIFFWMMKYLVHVNEKYFHMGGEKLGKERMQVLDPLMCGTNERKQ